MTIARPYPLLLILVLISLFLGLLLFAGSALAALIGIVVTAGPVLLLWTMGMAFAGAGNRLAWTGLFAVFSILGALLLGQVSSAVLDSTGVAGGVFGCAAIALVPALLLCSATLLRRRRGAATVAAAIQ